MNVLGAEETIEETKKETKIGTPIRIINGWCDDFIPAIYLRQSTIIPGWIDVWIPEGYGSCGYSTRDRIYAFTWNDDVKFNVLQQWVNHLK